MESRTHLNRDMDMGAILVIGIVSIFLVVEIAIGTETWFFSTRGEQQAAKSVAVQNPGFVEAYDQQMINIEGIDQAIADYVKSVPANKPENNLADENAH